MKQIKNEDGTIDCFTDAGVYIDTLEPVEDYNALTDAEKENVVYTLENIVEFERTMISRLSTLEGRREWRADQLDPDPDYHDSLTLLERFRLHRNNVYEYDNRHTLKHVN